MKYAPERSSDGTVKIAPELVASNVFAIELLQCSTNSRRREQADAETHVPLNSMHGQS